MPSAVSGGSNPFASESNPFNQLIQSTIQIERQPQLELKNERGEIKRFDGVLDDFDSKLSALHTSLESLTDPVSNPFQGRSAQVTGETDAYSVTASDNASFGTHSLAVDRLASEDGRVSQQYTASGTSLRNFFDTNGQQTFSIGVSTPTNDNPDARTNISVTVDPSGSTNEEILQDVRAAIDTAMTSAVDNGTIESKERPSVSVVNETSDTARLSLRSAQKGYQGRLTFSDSANGLLSTLEVNADQLASGTSGGQITDVGTSETDSKLNSKFNLDGLTLYRNTNRVTDALEGVTLSLEEATGTETSFEVAPDTEGITESVKSFIDKYNSVLDYIKKKSNIDAEAGERGDFAGERAFTGLRYGMRNDVIQTVSGLPEGTNALREIGIEINKDGTLTLGDEGALESAVEKDADTVRALFSGDDGVATRLKERVSRFVETGGVIDERQKTIDSEIDRLDDRISAFDDRLQRREQQLRDRFAQIQKTIRSLQSQQQAISLSSGQ